MKPYGVGGWLEKRCGRSMRRCPLSLSSSNLTVSVVTISMYASTTPAGSPGGTPCQGCAWNMVVISFSRALPTGCCPYHGGGCVVNRPRHGQHVRHERPPVAAGCARLPLQRPEGKDRGGSHQAGGDCPRSLPRLQLGRRRALPGDRAGSRPLVQVHRPRQPGGGDLHRDRGARARRHRRVRFQAGDGGQGRPLQEVRRHRRLRPGGRRQGRRHVLQGGQGAGADLRRRQPRGREEPGVLRHRAAPARGDADPRVPRRPARHRHHHRGRADQRSGAGGKAHRGRQGGLRRGRRCGGGLRRAVREAGGPPRAHLHVRQVRPRLSGAARGHGRVERRVRAGHAAPLSPGSDQGRVRGGRPVRAGGDLEGDGRDPGPQSDPFRPRESGAGDPPGGGPVGPLRRDHGHRPQRLPQPGEQRTRISGAVPESVSAAYGGQVFSFGREYIIPKPFDPRVLIEVAPAVAQAAMDSGVARVNLDRGTYVEALRRRQGRTYEVMSVVVSRARRRMTRIAFPEGNHPRILRAAQQLAEERICTPVLLGRREEILEQAKEAHLAAICDLEIVDPLTSDRSAAFAQAFYALRQRHGISWAEALYRIRQRNTFAAMMVREGLVDGLVTGLTRTYPEAIRPALEVVRTQQGRRASGTYIVAFKESLKLFADCTVNADPTAEELADIAISTAELARAFELTPRIAMLSYSNFGTDRGGSPAKVRRAVELVRVRRPDLEVEGEMQVDPAVVRSVREAEFPFARLGGDANVLIFPELNSGNIGYKLLWRLGGAEVIGPVLMGMAKPVNVLQQGASVQDVVNLAAMTAVRAQGELTY